MKTLAALLLLLGVASQAEAHRLAPSYLELREEGAGTFAVLWRTPSVVARGARLAPQLPCPASGETRATEEPAALVLRWRIQCAEGLVDHELRVDGLAGSGSDALVRIEFADGRELQAVLSAARPALRVPARIIHTV